MKKLSKKEKAIIECYASKYASVDNWKYLKEHASNNEEFQRRDTIFKRERNALWAMDNILECLNVRFQCERVDLEKIVLRAFNAENYNKLYEVTLTYINYEWKVAD